MATAWHSGAPPAQPHGRAAPGSPAALLSSGSGPPGSTCTRSWVRRRTQEPKVALRPVARRGSSTLSRYSLSSQARGLTPSGSARPTRLRAGCLCLGHGTAGSRRAQGTWAGDALHQGVHQGLPERPAQCPGCLVVRKEAVGKALLVLQRPVQSATATGQHTVPGAGELPRESRAHWWLPALPLAKAQRLRGPTRPSSQGGPLTVSGTCPQWPSGPSQPLPNRGCAEPVATRSCCAWPTSATSGCASPCGGPASPSGGLAQLKPRGPQGGPGPPGPLVARKEQEPLPSRWHTQLLLS